MSLFLVISIFMIIIFDDDYYLLTKPQAAPWSAAKSCQVSCKDFTDGQTIELNMMMMVMLLSEETKISIETHIETFFETSTKSIFETTDGNFDSKILPSKLDRLQ